MPLPVKMPSMEITRHFASVNGREVHYRRAGSGPPVLLFHVSPQTSAFVLSELGELADQFTLIGLDTPGYGESGPLRQSQPTIADYAEAAREAMDALGLGRVPVYGSHTGANIAVELARRAPDRVSGLVLDGLSLNTPDVAQDRVRRYAPQFVPTDGGEHLAWAWQHTRDQLLFWPWYEPHRANRLSTDIKSADYLHDVVVAKMSATAYWLGYRAAFSHDAREALRDLRVETYFVTAAADSHTEIERSIDDLPPCIHFVDTRPDTQLPAIRRALEAVQGDGGYHHPQMATSGPRFYATLPQGQRLVRRWGKESGRPLVALHGGMSTSLALFDELQGLGVNRLVLAPDIAGAGDSDALPTEESDLERFAADVRDVLRAEGVKEFDVYGESGGASLALELARQTGAPMGRLVLSSPELPDDATKVEMTTRVAPEIEARWDGSHLLTAWHILRDSKLFWPWYQRSTKGVRDIEPLIEPVALQRQLLAWLKGRLTYGNYVRAALAADPSALSSAVDVPTLVVTQSGDLLEEHGRRLADSMSNAELVRTATGLRSSQLTEAFLLEG